MGKSTLSDGFLSRSVIRDSSQRKCHGFASDPCSGSSGSGFSVEDVLVSCVVTLLLLKIFFHPLCLYLSLSFSPTSRDKSCQDSLVLLTDDPIFLAYCCVEHVFIPLIDTQGILHGLSQDSSVGCVEGDGERREVAWTDECKVNGKEMKRDNERPKMMGPA